MKICITCKKKDSRKVAFVGSQCVDCYGTEPFKEPEMVIINKKEVRPPRRVERLVFPKPKIKRARKESKIKIYKKKLKVKKQSSPRGRKRAPLDVLIPENKRCIICEEVKHISKFYLIGKSDRVNYKVPDSYCKKCRHNKSVSWKSKNQNKSKEYHKKYWAEYSKTYVRK